MRTIPESIDVVVYRHAETGMMVAVSPDMPGMYVHGDTDEEINQRVPQAIRALVEADKKRAEVRAANLSPPAGFAKHGKYSFNLEAA